MEKQQCRDSGGKFTKGNRYGRGNPHAKKHAQLRNGLLNAITQKDVSSIVKRLTADAIDGNTQAAKIILDRYFGPIIAPDIMERLEEMENQLNELNDGMTVR